jgi:hypothetical protein
VYRFRNAHQCARELGVDAATFQSWLVAARIDQDTVSRVAFNVSRWHADASLVSVQEAPALTGRAWAAFQTALQRGLADGVVHDLDYDDVWDETFGNR